MDGKTGTVHTAFFGAGNRDLQLLQPRIGQGSPGYCPNALRSPIFRVPVNAVVVIAVHFRLCSPKLCKHVVMLLQLREAPARFITRFLAEIRSCCIHQAWKFSQRSKAITFCSSDSA